MYYPFGMVMPNTNNLNAGTYTYGLNGMMRDNEVKGNGNSYTSYWRQYDPRLGRWMSDEPKPVAWESGYAAFRDNPIAYADPNGDFAQLCLGAGVHNFFVKLSVKGAIGGLIGKGVVNASAKSGKANSENKESGKTNSDAPPKWMVSYGNNLSTPNQTQQGLSHPTLIQGFNGQTYYNTNSTNFFGLYGDKGKMDFDEINTFIQIQRRLSSTSNYVGINMYKQKIEPNALNFKHEALTQVEASFSKNYFLVNSGRNNFNISLNVGFSAGIALSNPTFVNNSPATVTNPGTLPNNYQVSGVSWSIIARVDATVVKRISIFVAGTISSINTFDVDTSIGVMKGQDYDSVGIKGGIGIKIGR